MPRIVSALLVITALHSVVADSATDDDKHTYNVIQNHVPVQFAFDPARDHVVVLHIQKTGGSDLGTTFLALKSSLGCTHWSNRSAADFIADELKRDPASQEWTQPGAFNCPASNDAQKDWNQPESLSSVRSQWLIARATVGWPCGKHPSVARLVSCITGWMAESPLVAHPESEEWRKTSHFESAKHLAHLSTHSRVTAGAKNIFIVTILRDPVTRYVSEFLHTTSGWSRRNDGLDDAMLHDDRALIASDFYCNGTAIPRLPSCRDWAAQRTSKNRESLITRGKLLADLGMTDRSATIQHRKQEFEKNHADGEINDVLKNQMFQDSFTLDEFIDCPYNTASNRQTRMLSFQPCADSGTEIDEVSDVIIAFQTINALPYFAFEEYPVQSAELLEWTFGIKIDPIIRNEQPHESVTPIALAQLSDDVKDRIKKINQLDVLLYEHAAKVFKTRLAQCASCSDLPI